MILEQTNNETRKPRRKWLRALAAAVLLLLAVALGLLWYVNTASFQRYVHDRVVQALEDVTGGRVELSQLNWKLRDLKFEAAGLTIHGLEGEGERPYVQAQEISMDGTACHFSAARSACSRS